MYYLEFCYAQLSKHYTFLSTGSPKLDSGHHQSLPERAKNWIYFTWNNQFYIKSVLPYSVSNKLKYYL